MIPDLLTLEEVEHLRGAVETPLEKAVFQTLYSADMSIVELVSLECGAIQKWTIRGQVRASAIVRDEHDNERRIWFDVKATRTILEYEAAHPYRRHHLFETENGEPYTVAGIVAMLNGFARRINLRKMIGPETLRRSGGLMRLTHDVESHDPRNERRKAPDPAKNLQRRLYDDKGGEVKREVKRRMYWFRRPRLR